MVAMAISRVVCTLFLCFVVLGQSLKIETPNYSRDEYNAFVDSIWDVVSTLGADTPDLNIKKTSDKAGIELEFTTQNDSKYHFFPVRNTSMQFQIKASSDVYIAFTTEPFEKNPVEVPPPNTLFIKDFGSLPAGENLRKLEKKEILNAKEYRGYLLRWNDGVILAWRTGEHRPFISWIPPRDIPIAYLGVRTGAGVSGSWIIEDYKAFIKRSENQDSRKQISTINFKVKTANDAHIGFFTTPAKLQGQMIEIVIGGWNNKKSVINRGNYTLKEVAEVEIPGLLNSSEYRGFWVHWGDDISLGREGEHCPFMTWPDPEPFQATHLGIHTGYGAVGSWKIEDWEETWTPDSTEYTFQPFAVLTGLSDSSSAAIDSW